MSRDFPCLLYEDIPGIPGGMVRERKDMIQHLRSLQQDGRQDEGMGIQDLAYLLRNSSVICQEHEGMSLVKRRNSLAKFVAVNVLPMPNDQLQKIAIAGFFYNGTDCTLTCYHCGCNALDWKQDDEPWTRHGELQPNCPVIKMRQMTRTSSNAIIRRSLSF